MPRGLVVLTLCVVTMVAAIAAVLWTYRAEDQGGTPVRERPLPPLAATADLLPSAAGPVIEPPATRANAPDPGEAVPVTRSDSPLASVRPLPGEFAASRRARVGTSIEGALCRLSDVWHGWGLDGTRAVLAAAASKFGEAGDPLHAPILLALADTEFRLGHDAAASERLIEAVLAMDPEWARELHSAPRLVYFA